ncbi:OmpA family protein [Paramylibacter kogurei]|nr:OmpA family protein [Amylibacter kogurei]
MTLKKLTISISFLAALGACAPESRYTTLGGRDAGADALHGGFGYATANNVKVMSISERLEYIKSLTRLFASEAPATINFAFDSAKLDANAQAQLRQQAQWILAHPDITFRVFGHADKVGSNAYNQRLGKRRAQAAVNYLIAQGVDRRKVEAVVSFGETRPLVLTQGRSRENRRTVTEVKGFYNPANDGLLDGKYARGIYRRYVGEGDNTQVSSNQ